MEIVKFRRGRLALGALLMAASAALFIALFLYPEAAARVRGARLFATSLGHNLVAPALIVASIAIALRSAALAIGDSPAVEARRDALYVTTMWRRHRIAWRDLAAVALQPYCGQDHLVFHSGAAGATGGTAYRINLGQLDLHPDRVEDLFDRIERVRAGTSADRAAAPAPRPEPQAPARPAFGRKAV